MKKESKDSSDYKKVKLYKKNTSDKKNNYKWILIITLWTFAISSLVSYASDIVISNVDIIFALIILVLIILLGIMFDIIGVSVTAADETPFHSMASRKVKGARTAVKLIRNADKVSNFCNDVIGDICGVISGGTGAVITEKIVKLSGGDNKVIIAIAMAALIASITVGGKAMGKHFAINQSNNIIYKVAWFIETLNGKNKK